ncbi:PH-like domain-containing protein [Mycobacterium palustre]|uniref:Transporter n=1 Tax=Mycobacterium palustre TaxID=153971 RepID=A0A1X1ZRQ9_9MYCO|nr:transporter [Mycobacterium palustre]MCV7099659.1 transporter [Mycobacterium palustre]ORW26069.1 transporter [Mycobacterium palustre]
MNSGTMAGSLIFLAVLVVVLTVVIQLMMRGWQRRAQRQAELLGGLPDVPDTVGTALVTTRGVYCGCTMAPEWNERITAGDLGYRSKAVLTRYPEGILLERTHAKPIWIPTDSVVAIRMERGLAGKVVARVGILAIRWRLPSGVELDIGFRANSRSDYDDWVKDGRQGEVA